MSSDPVAPPPGVPRLGVLESVDVLRGIAILMVIAVHSRLNGVDPTVHYWSGFGRNGVQLFFIASAFTLMASVQGKSHSAGFWKSFFTRRLFRIAPMYWIGALVYPVFFSILWKQPIVWTSVVANLAFVHGLVPAANNSVVPGGWSIGTEMLFYALFPLVAFCCSTKKGTWAMLGVSVVVSFGCLYAFDALKLPREEDTFGYFFILVQMPVFLLGCLLFQYRDLVLGGGRRPWALLGGMALSLAGFVTPTPAGWEHIPISLGLLLFSVGVMSYEGALGRFRWLQRVGQYSFSMYVVHYGVLVLLARLPIHPAEAMQALRFVVGGLVTFGLASLTSLLIEKPALEFGRRLAKKVA